MRNSSRLESLMSRVAKLERKNANVDNTVYTVEKGECNSIALLGKKMKPEDLELVFLNALSHNLNKHREALALSKGLGLTTNNLWLGNKRIARLSNILIANKVLSKQSLGKVFAQYCREYATKKERVVLKMLKSILMIIRPYFYISFLTRMEIFHKF